MSIYAICPVTAAPIRMSASHRSEMASQLLFGEIVECLEEKGRQWTKVRCCHDEYIGWMATDQLLLIDEPTRRLAERDYAYVFDLFQPLMSSQHFQPVTVGARLPGFDGMRFHLGLDTFTFSGQAIFPHDVKPTVELVVKVARRLLNVPFMWGGRSPLGIDGPALVQLVYSLMGQALPRTADMQIRHGESVHFMETTQPGDIAFFENNHGRITHSGIILPYSQIIHVGEKVRIDQLDHYGIFNLTKGRYTHRLRLVKRLLPTLAKTTAMELATAEADLTQIAIF